MKPPPEGHGKKPYQEPNLRLYGDIQALTKSHSHQVKANDSSTPNKT